MSNPRKRHDHAAARTQGGPNLRRDRLVADERQAIALHGHGDRELRLHERELVADALPRTEKERHHLGAELVVAHAFTGAHITYVFP